MHLNPFVITDRRIRRDKFRMRILLTAFFLFFLSCVNTLAQAPAGVVSGNITDSSGSAVTNAQINLKTVQQVVLASTRTDPDGEYRFENIAPGSYLIVARSSNFNVKRQPVRLLDSSALEVDLVLSVNDLTAEVTVTADMGQASESHKVPQQINVVSEDAIQQRVTSVLAQVANEETGVTMQRTSPTIGSVLVRGLTEVGVYVDGIRYTNSTQRGGINTFFNMNEPTGLQSVEIQRSPNTAQFGSDGLGGNVQLLSRQPAFGLAQPRWNGELNSYFGSADRSFGTNALISYGARRFGILSNIVARRVNPLRPGGGVDSHSAINRFFGLPSDIVGTDRLTDTGFTQYGGTLHANYAITDGQNLSFRYQRSQQDGGRRYDQLLGGDGNLIAELKNLQLDFAYIRYFKQQVGPFDTFSANVSYNGQREERQNQGGQGNPLAMITSDKERTASWGFGFFFDKQFSRNNLLFGGDYYRDGVTAPSFSVDLQTGRALAVRPRVPNGATHGLGGLYVQDIFEAIPNRLRISGSLRYNIAAYRSLASNSPLVNGAPLFPDDSGRFTDFSGRVGATYTVIEGMNVAFNFSRGFRAPNITALGGLGLVGVGFQVSAADVEDLGATIGSTADASAVTTGEAVTSLRSEVSNNYDLSFRYRNRRFDMSLTGFVIDYGDSIVRQTLILPPGAVGLQLGSQAIIDQNANGAVFVPASTSPVLVQANFGETRMRGIEANFEYRFLDSWMTSGNYSYVHAEDRRTREVPNLGGGGLPPQFGFLRLRYQPPGKSFWIEGYAKANGRQDRLSSLDLSDRRTGGARTRNQIQNFFRRGACVRGLTTVGANGQCGSAGGILLATGESLAQVQDRVLPLGATINSVLISGNDTAAPLFRAVPGYVLVNIRGGYRVNDNIELTADLENITDKSHRAPGWGIDGPGRGLTVRMRYRF